MSSSATACRRRSAPAKQQWRLWSARRWNQPMTLWKMARSARSAPPPAPRCYRRSRSSGPPEQRATAPDAGTTATSLSPSGTVLPQRVLRTSWWPAHVEIVGLITDMGSGGMSPAIWTPAMFSCVAVTSPVFVSPASTATLVHSGDTVYVWGHDGKQPEDYTQQESIPADRRPSPGVHPRCGRRPGC